MADLHEDKKRLSNRVSVLPLCGDKARTAQRGTDLYSGYEESEKSGRRAWKYRGDELQPTHLGRPAFVVMILR